MRQLKIMEHISLDGVVQHTADENGFPHADWTAPYRTPAGRDAVLAAQGEAFDLLLGRRTYDFWSGYWPRMPPSPLVDRLNAATKHVATHRPGGLAWGPARTLGPDLADGVRRLKDTPGPDLLLWGSSTLTAPLLAAGLVDTVVLLVYPVWLGTGKRFLADGAATYAFELLDSRALASGIVVNTLRAAGPLKGG